MYIKISSTYKVISFVYVPRVGTTTLTIISNGNHSSAEKIRLKFAYIRMKKKIQKRTQNIYISNRMELISLLVFFQISFGCSYFDASAVAGGAVSHLFRLKLFDVVILFCAQVLSLNSPQTDIHLISLDKCVKIDIYIDIRIRIRFRI